MGEGTLMESTVLMTAQYFFFPFIIFIFLAFLWFVAGILICLWVYNDARSRGMEGALWVLIVLVANIVGLIIYLFVREGRRPSYQASSYSTGQKRFCSSCGKEHAPNAKFCSQCGKAVT